MEHLTVHHPTRAARTAGVAGAVWKAGAAAVWLSLLSGTAQARLEVGFAQADITPAIRADAPVWLAGYYPGRAAVGVHDPLYARTIVLRNGTEKLAWIAVDLIGLQWPDVQRLRARLPDYRYVLVASTHNHEGPDVIGVWGKSYLHRGVDELYVQRVVALMEQSVREAERKVCEVQVSYGTAVDESLLDDKRLPVVKDGVLRLLRFTDSSDGRTAGLVVQWNCHPETLGRDNQLITADFPAATIAALGRRYGCPTVYFTGAIGGLIAPPSGRIRGEQGQWLEEGDFEFARRYGEEVAALAGRAIETAQPIRLTPFHVSAARTGVPMTNRIYRWARLLGILRREAYVWHGDGRPLGEPLREVRDDVTPAIETEVACLQLGELCVATVPGELFPELVYGPLDDPARPGADYPDAPIEPTIAQILPGTKWLLLGLANDEIGYIIPRRQWDERPPYMYGRTMPPYGEINSCGPHTATAILKSLQARVAELSPTE